MSKKSEKPQAVRMEVGIASEPNTRERFERIANQLAMKSRKTEQTYDRNYAIVSK